VTCPDDISTVNLYVYLAGDSCPVASEEDLTEVEAGAGSIAVALALILSLI